jgi:hypothetical protein
VRASKLPSIQSVHNKTELIEDTVLNGQLGTNVLTSERPLRSKRWTVKSLNGELSEVRRGALRIAPLLIGVVPFGLRCISRFQAPGTWLEGLLLD